MQLIGAALVLTFLVTVVDGLNRIFDTAPLTSSQWGICLLAAPFSSRRASSASSWIGGPKRARASAPGNRSPEVA